MIVADSLRRVSVKILFLPVLNTAIYSGPIFKNRVHCVTLVMLRVDYFSKLVSLLGSPEYQEGHHRCPALSAQNGVIGIFKATGYVCFALWRHREL